jgi:hypothetical protein
VCKGTLKIRDNKIFLGNNKPRSAVCEHKFSVFAHNLVDLCQKNAVFSVKMGPGSLLIPENVVPLHRQSEMMTLQ